MQELKQEYNYNLKKYYAGCKYIEQHRNECNKWLPIVLKFLNNINTILSKIMQVEKVTKEQILEGF